MPKGDYKKGRGRGITFLRAHVNFDGDECLIWPFGRDQDGYGTFGLDGRVRKAHRWMCEAIRGAPPTPLHCAAHECGNGHLGCISPKHLFWKTNAENTADMVRHGTTRRDTGRLKRKLDREKVAYIRAAKGEKTIADLALMFGITQRQVKKIQQGISWSHTCRQERVFTPDEIRKIRSLRGVKTQVALAEEFGVLNSVIHKIQTGKTYVHVAPNRKVEQ